MAGEEEGEDYYYIRLSYRPETGFRGEPGIEQFTIDKAGPIELREIVQRPRERRASVSFSLRLESSSSPVWWLAYSLLQG